MLVQDRAAQRHRATDYAKWDRLDYTALGLDDREAVVDAAESATASRGSEWNEYVKHQRDVADAKQRLRELEDERLKAELRLQELERQHKRFDRILTLVTFCGFFLLGLLGLWLR